MTRFLTLFTAALIAFAQPALTANYTLDADHTSVTFKIKHLLTWVSGDYDEVSGSFVYDPENPESWQVEATINAASIDTNNKDRDKHLRSNDFFDVENHPEITFKSTKVNEVEGDSAKLHGLLSIHGVEKEVVLDLEVLGVGDDPWGNTIAAFSATTEINRKDYGLGWNEVLETGQLLVGEKVKITLDVAGLLQE